MGDPVPASTMLRAMARRSTMLRRAGQQMHAKYMELLADRDRLRALDTPHEDCCPLGRDGDPDIRRYHSCTGDTRPSSSPVDLTSLPHESWCDLGDTHADCCPGKAERGCSCLTGEVVAKLRGERDE